MICGEKYVKVEGYWIGLVWSFLGCGTLMGQEMLTRSRGGDGDYPECGIHEFSSSLDK